MLRERTSQGSAIHWATRVGAICLLAALACACAGPPVPVPGFFRYSRSEVKAFLERNKAKESQAWELDRSSDGTRLYLYSFSEWAAILEPSGTLKIAAHKPSSLAYLNDEGQWAAWLTPGEAHFEGWARPAKGLWADRGARHYLLETRDGRLELGTVNGSIKQALDDRFTPLRIFGLDGKVYVFGVWREAKETRCLVFRETASAFEPEKTVVIAPVEFPVSVVDMDLSAERVVLDRSLDLRPLWVLYDFRTGKLTNIGTTSDYGLFLKEDLLGRALHPEPGTSAR